MAGVARLRPRADTNGRARMASVRSACRVSQLQEVVDRADHRPFASDLVEAPQQELPEASGMFDMPEHRLDDLFAQPVAAAAAGPLELGRHGGLARPARPLSRPGRMLSAMARAAGSQIRGDAAAGQMGEVD